jgi:hypothetical protein
MAPPADTGQVTGSTADEAPSRSKKRVYLPQQVKLLQSELDGVMAQWQTLCKDNLRMRARETLLELVSLAGLRNYANKGVLSCCQGLAHEVQCTGS